MAGQQRSSAGVFATLRILDRIGVHHRAPVLLRGPAISRAVEHLPFSRIGLVGGDRMVMLISIVKESATGVKT
jgi:hypothetical protein